MIIIPVLILALIMSAAALIVEVMATAVTAVVAVAMIIK